jgi:peptide/nickel transport system permease protein
MGKQMSAQVGPRMARWREGGGRGEVRAALTAFILRRVLQSIVIMLIVTTITFGLLRMIPGNVAVEVMGTNAYRDPGAIKVFNADYRFNLPWCRQHFLWLGNLARGNLGAPL